MSSARPMQRFSHRVFKVFALSLLTISAIYTANFLLVQKQRLESGLVDRSRGLGGLLATGSRIAVYSETAELARETLQGVVERRDVLSAAIFTLERATVLSEGRSPKLKAGAAALTPPDLALVERLGPQSGCLSRQGIDVVVTLCPVLIHNHPRAAADLYFDTEHAGEGEQQVGFVKVTLDRRPMLRELGSLALRSLALMLVILLAGSWAGLHFSRRVTEPLGRLTEAVRAFGSGGETRELAGMPEDEIGRLAEAFTKMTRDIAEREREQERLTERLRHAQQMEAVGALSQGISHDFKNILSTLKAAVHILRKGSPDNEFVLKYTGRMQTSIDRARDLVERLVTFSRTRRVELRPLDLAGLVGQLAPMLREAVGESVRLNVDLPASPVRVDGDGASLEQLLLNLAYNGRDAMPDGGVLCVRVEAAPPAAPGARGSALLTVRDTGVGMEPEVRRRLFEPFFTTKGGGAGMGLGLSIVHGIVEQHGGAVDVESEPGGGAAFRVLLPLSQAGDAGGEAG